MKLTEVAEPISKEIQQWLTSVCQGPWRRRSSGEIDTDGNVYLGKTIYTTLPVHFGVVDGLFHAGSYKGDTLEGFPTQTKNILLTSCPNITSFETLQLTHIESSLNIDNGRVTSLHNIHEHLEYARVINSSATSHVLGVLLIPGMAIINTRCPKADIILVRHLQKPEVDLHECQEELLDAGFSDYARL